MEWTLGDWITTAVRNKDTSSIAKVDLRYLADTPFSFFIWASAQTQAKRKWLRVKHTGFFNSTRKRMWIYWETSLFWARGLPNSASEYYYTVVSGRLDEENHFSPCGFSKSTLWAKFWCSLVWGEGWQLSVKWYLFFQVPLLQEANFLLKIGWHHLQISIGMNIKSSPTQAALLHIQHGWKIIGTKGKDSEAIWHEIYFLSLSHFYLDSTGGHSSSLT